MNRVFVNPEILQWAGQRAGLDVGDLLPKFPKLQDWFEGSLAPTLKQLEAFSHATHTPIGFFFLPKPPEISLPIPDFRTMGGDAHPVPSPDLLDTIYLCQQRQDWYREYARLYHEEPIAWIGQGTVDADIVATAATLRQQIGLDLFQRQGGSELDRGAATADFLAGRLRRSGHDQRHRRQQQSSQAIPRGVPWVRAG